MSDTPADQNTATVTLPGKVDKIIPSPVPGVPEKVQISLEGASDLYREIRVENTLRTAKGAKVALKPEAEVDVTIEAPAEAVVSKDRANP